MRKLPAAAQEERRRQVIGLRQRGMTYQEIADLVGLRAYPGRAWRQLMMAQAKCIMAR